MIIPCYVVTKLRSKQGLRLEFPPEKVYLVCLCVCVFVCLFVFAISQKLLGRFWRTIARWKASRREKCPFVFDL